ncbi:107_t:CDS:2, partial [Acaulospora colombiana]
MDKHDIRRVEKPKVYTPYKRHRTHVLRYKGSVIKSAIIPAIVVAAVAAVLVCYSPIEPTPPTT